MIGKICTVIKNIICGGRKEGSSKVIRVRKSLYEEWLAREFHTR